ncbi:unnamed protein product [Sphagnum jensenii]|uniref:CST complex subunit CTC1 n=1 Tax=Sphagnum jensenii TaxID=128206 RepID=A0ABP0WTY5_9BRYO
MLGNFCGRFPPFSNFCDHIESLWHDPHSIVWQAGKKHCDCFDTHSEWNPSLGLQTGENSAHYVRRIISSAELGLVLIGSLRDSGKLQLVDATGALDVMIPDLQCFANLSSTHQIASFNLVVEGKWRTSTHSAKANGGRLPNSPVAWSTLLKGLVFKMEPSNLLSYYVHFQIQHASCLKNLVWPSRETCTSNPSWLRKFNQIESHNNSWKGRQFEILMVTHKHPVWLKPGVEAGEGNQWTLYAEAILLPFCLHIVGESSAPNECSYLPMANIQMDLRNSRMTNLNKRPDAKYQEGGFEGSNADLDNSATGNRVVTGCSIGCSVCFLLNEYPGGKMKVE